MKKKNRTRLDSVSLISTEDEEAMEGPGRGHGNYIYIILDYLDYHEFLKIRIFSNIFC